MARADWGFKQSSIAETYPIRLHPSLKAAIKALAVMISGDFASAATLRGVGWGNQRPIEHTYLLYYKPAERPKYIEAFLTNIDWTGTQWPND